MVQLVNSSGTVVKEYQYDAFGVEYDLDSNDTNYFRYTGQYLDIESGTYYLRARYYNTANGRFTQQDWWGFGNPYDPLSLNLYIYCRHNPVMYLDPSGHDVESSLRNQIVQDLNNTIGEPDWWSSYISEDIDRALAIIMAMGNEYWKLSPNERLELVISLLEQGQSERINTKPKEETYVSTEEFITEVGDATGEAIVEAFANVTGDVGEAVAEGILEVLDTCDAVGELACEMYNAIPSSAAYLWNWLINTKAGQITWNSLWLIVSVAGLVVSIAGVLTPPASALGVWGLRISIISTAGSFASLMMAIFN